MTGETGTLTTKNFWRHAYPKSLNVRGRLVLAYIYFAVGDSDLIILEDVAVWCGMDQSEVVAWLNIFKTKGYIGTQVRWEGDTA